MGCNQVHIIQVIYIHSHIIDIDMKRYRMKPTGYIHSEAKMSMHH